MKGVPYDTPILGYRVNTANTLRLWRAEAPESFDFSVFNRGDYWGAVNQKVISENITKVLYPNDEQVRGKELRLEQQYFFVSCSLQDMLRIIARADRFRPSASTRNLRFSSTIPIPRSRSPSSCGCWSMSWRPGLGRAPGQSRATPSPTPITRCCPRRSSAGRSMLFGRLLPRHLEIIYEINARFLDEVRIAFFGDEQRLARMSLIDESGERYVRMAHLATRRQSCRQWRRRPAHANCSRATCCAISTSCGRRNSATRPTA